MLDTADRLAFERRRLPLRLALLLAPILMLADRGVEIAPGFALMTVTTAGSTAFIWYLLRYWPEAVERWQLGLRLLDIGLIFIALLEVNRIEGVAKYDALYMLPIASASAIGQRRGLIIVATAATLAVLIGRFSLDAYGLAVFDQREALRCVFIGLLFVYVGAVVQIMMRRSAEAVKRRERGLRDALANQNRSLELLAEQLADANANLIESEGRFRRLAENAPDVIYRFHLKPQPGFSYISSASQVVLGYRPEELYAKPELVRQHLHPDDWPVVESLIVGRVVPNLVTLRWHDHNQRLIWCELRNTPIVSADGEVVAIEGIVRDITERKRFEEQLVHNALHDALTMAPNRALFLDRLEQAIQRSRWPLAQSHPFAVLFLDLDRFKTINDSLGHIAGDALLIAIARRLEACVRAGDTVARFGGDEFAILIETVSETADAIKVAERIQAALATPFDIQGHEVYAAVSIGIALSHAGYQQPAELLRDADLAMYHAKALGRARYQVFDQAMHGQAVVARQIEIDLRHAVERGEFKLAYQPIVELATGRRIGFEALLRWEHPQRGLVPPTEFIPVAEETRLILPIGRWVIEEACRQLRVWQTSFPDAEDLSISVNLSIRQFAQPDLVDQVTGALTRTGLAGRRLCLEITESVLMENIDVAREMLGRLRALGVQISIDDFGAGYSSLSYLHALPLDSLKIDRSFIARIDEDERLAIVRAIVELARHLGLAVIAEGVETAAQRRQLAALRCAYAQGFLFAPPLSAEEVRQHLAGPRANARAS